jgi:Protein of unknown function (DUF3570)
MKRSSQLGKINGKPNIPLSVRITSRIQENNLTTSPLTALTGAALVLPGLFQTAPLFAADDNSVDFQYSHYQEGKRDIGSAIPVSPNFGAPLVPIKAPQNLNPIEVDSLHGSGRFTLTDRIKFAFNYTQDTWSGATPIGTAPVIAKGNSARNKRNNLGEIVAVTGASPLASSTEPVFLDKNLNFYSQKYDSQAGIFKSYTKHNQVTHVLSYASPETRKQGDFKLSYHWNEASLTVGGGISVENDYESRFANVGGSFDLNQKQTTINWGVSYTNSDTQATLDPDSYRFVDNFGRYPVKIYDEQGAFQLEAIPEQPLSAEITEIFDFDSSSTIKRTLNGMREDWGGQLGITQVMNKNALLALDVSFTHSKGYLGNPYKLVYFASTDNSFSQPVSFFGRLENRPDERNQFNWHWGYNQYIESLDAALHFNYYFGHDSWDIHAHTFEADWVQSLGEGWTLTPRIRYYSQSAADFYAPYFVSVYDATTFEPINKIPDYYSSDQRLSGFGTLSGGVTVEKQFAKGVSLQTGFEYYTHQGGLKLGGGGEQDFADFDYWVANAALKVNLAALGMPGGHAGHSDSHHHVTNSPAGVQFDHVLPKAGDFMVGYRYMRNVQSGDFRLGDQLISIDQARKDGCYGEECAVTPNNMTMNMHMLDLMYAPTDWLTLMLMPQWTDMDMTMIPNPDVQLDNTHAGHAAVHEHQTGGIGDVGAYGLFKLYGDQHHQVNLALGGTAPTGDVDIVQRKTGINPIYNNPLHYCMQLGSGTWDFKPALTYTGNVDKFSWGAQANATIRLEGQNKSGFAFGDIFQGSVWGGYQWTEWLGTTVRGIYTTQGEIRGRYPTIFVDGFDANGNPAQVRYEDQHIDTFGQPQNYGGSFVDLGLGVNVTVPHGAFAGNSLKFEWLQPVYTNFNGYQPDRDYALNFTWSYGF